jgi:drug/metabolite transporter (DMT)-like permease
VGRDDDTEAAVASIVEAGRRMRKPTPRWLWIAALIVGTIGVAGFAIAMLSEGEPASATHPAPRSSRSSGLGSGLVIGAAVGIVIGFSIARQRRDHSSRSSP